MAFCILLLLCLVGASFAENSAVHFSNSSKAKAVPLGSTIYLSPPVTPTKTSCTYDCSYSGGRWEISTWEKISLAKTLTEAVVYHIVNNHTNSTSSVTSYYSLTDKFERWHPPTNAAGTQVHTMVVEDTASVGASKTITITYPTPHTSGSYRWWGERPATSDGHEICTSALWAWTPYSFVLSKDLQTTSGHARCSSGAGTYTGCSEVQTGSWAPYNQDSITKSLQTVDPEDPQGFYYTFTSSIGKGDVLPGYEDEVVGRCVQAEIPTNPCKMSERNLSCVMPIAAMAQALYLTVTSTSYESKVPQKTSSAPTTSHLNPKLPVETSGKISEPDVQNGKTTKVFSSASTFSAPSEERAEPYPMSTGEDGQADLDPVSQSSEHTVLENSEVLTYVTVVSQISTTETSAGTTIEPSSPEETLRTTNDAIPTTIVQSSSLSVTTSIPIAVIPVTTDPSASTPLPVDLTVSWNDQSEAIVGTKTLLPESSGIVGSGPSTTLVVLHTSESATQIEIGSTTYTVPVPTLAPATLDEPVFITTLEYTAHTSVGGQTLQTGSPPFHGTGETTTAAIQPPIETSKQALTQSITDVTVSVQQAESSAPSQTLLAGIPISSNSQSQLLVGTQTLNPGSSITVGSGDATTILELHTSDSVTQVVAGDKTIILPDASPTYTVAEAQTTAPEITLDGLTISNAEKSHVVLGTKTLALGSSVTLGSGSSTTVFALGTSGSATQLVAGSTTVALEGDGFVVSPSAELLSVTPVVLGGVTVTQDSQSHFLVGSTTISPGSTVTITSGTVDQVVAVQTSNGVTEVVIGTVTRTVMPVPGSRSVSSERSSGADSSGSATTTDQSNEEPATSASASSLSTSTSNAAAHYVAGGIGTVWLRIACLFMAVVEGIPFI